MANFPPGPEELYSPSELDHYFLDPDGLNLVDPFAIPQRLYLIMMIFMKGTQNLLRVPMTQARQVHALPEAW